MLFLVSRSLVTLARVVGAGWALFSSVGAAQRCAYAVELGRIPAERDMKQLGIDPKDVSALLRA